MSIFFPSLFSHFTRDFVEDFDILLMHKGCLKGDGEGQRQQKKERAAAAAAVAAKEKDCGGKMTKVWGVVKFNLFLLVWVFQVEFCMHRTSIIPVW